MRLRDYAPLSLPRSLVFSFMVIIFGMMIRLRQADILATGSLRTDRPGGRALRHLRVGERQSQYDHVHVDERRSTAG